MDLTAGRCRMPHKDLDKTEGRNDRGQRHDEE